MMKLNQQNNSKFGNAPKAIRWSIHGQRFIADFVLAGEFISYSTFYTATKNSAEFLESGASKEI